MSEQDAAGERWATGEPYRHDKYGWACLTWYRVRDFATEHGKTFLSASDLGPEIARQMAQANTDYLNALEGRVQAAEQQLREAREILYRWLRGSGTGTDTGAIAVTQAYLHAYLTASPAQLTRCSTWWSDGNNRVQCSHSVGHTGPCEDVPVQPTDDLPFIGDMTIEPAQPTEEESR